MSTEKENTLCEYTVYIIFTYTHGIQFFRIINVQYFM